jgi:hypothetical protein
MKTNHCQKCNKYQVCTKIKDCPLTKAEMKRLERGRHKHTIDIVYMHEMTEKENQYWDKIIYGDSEE